MAFSLSENKGILSTEGRKSICATCCGLADERKAKFQNYFRRARDQKRQGVLSVW
jgi:hypothetical protein